MSKIRDEYLNNPIAGLSQFLFRKLVNHDPMALMRRVKVDARTRRAHGTVYKEDPIWSVEHGQQSDNTVLYPLQDGRVFAVTVTELSLEAIKHQVAYGALVEA